MKKEELALKLRAAQERIAELEAMRVNESRDDFARIFHASPTQMALTDSVSGMYVDVNDTFLRTLGFARDEVLGKTSLELNLFKYPEQRRQLLQRMAEQGYLRDEHVLVCAKSGQVRHGIFSAEYIRSNGQSYLLTVMNDVTEKMQAEERWRFALEGAGDGVWDWNAQTNRVFFSHGWKAMLGYAEGDIGDSLDEWSSRVHPDDLAETLEKVNAHLAGQTSLYLSEHRLRCKDGSYKWILDRGMVIEWTTDHQPLRVIGTHKDITEQKNVEEALQASRRQLSQALIAARMGTWRWHIPTNRIELSPEVAQMFGIDIEPNDFGSVLEYFHPEDRVRLMESIQTAFAQKNMLQLEYRILDANGQIVWVTNYGNIEYDADGKPLAITGLIQDITERKHAQQALLDLNATLEERVKERTAQVQDLYDHAPVGYHSLDVEGRFIAINQTELDWLGYTREELLGQPITSIYTAQSADIFPTLFAQFKANGYISNQEVEVVRRDGTTFPVMINATLIYDEHGQYRASRSTMTDITERKRAENEIKRNINFINALLDAIPTPVFYKDKDGFYQGCNLAFVEIMGKTPTQVRGKMVYELWPSANANTYHQKDLELMQKGGRQIYESIIMDKDGNIRPVIFVKDIFYDESGGVAGLVGAFVDITERKRVEETLQRANAELQNAIRIKDEFLASMSHELRTPLNAVLGLSQSMIEQFIGPLNERQLRSMQTIESSGYHLLALINDILDLSKALANQMTLELAPVFVRRLCDASLLFVREMASKKYLQVTSVLDQAVEYVQADERRLKQILVNLLSNAVKFTPEGGVIELRVTGHSEQQMVRFSVSDTGIGIAPEDIDRLFQPFVQLDSGLNRQFEGTGLGLSLVARMTELHGGSVSVESEPGKGSTFTISLPWLSAAPFPLGSADQAQIPAPERANAFPVGTKIPLILIAEDNESNIAMLSTYLQSRGYHLAIARNGVEALNYARTKHPDLILMDLQMPVLDGLEATRRLRHERDPRVANIPVIALTALAMPSDRRRAIEAGANAYLSKPVDVKQLTDLITRLSEEQCYDRKDLDPR